MSADGVYGVIMGRECVAERLTARGYPMSVMMLEMMAELGEGPPYKVLKGNALYGWDQAIAWARATYGDPPGGMTDGLGGKVVSEETQRFWEEQGYNPDDFSLDEGQNDDR